MSAEPGPLARIASQLTTSGDATIHLIGDSARTGDWCQHPTADHRVVSDVVIETGIWNDSYGARRYEVARQIIACRLCGRVVAVPEVERPPS